MVKKQSGNKEPEAEEPEAEKEAEEPEAEKRTRRFNVRFKETQFKELKDFVEKETNYTLSEFVREAIKEKRERKENPNQQNNIGMSKEVMKLLKDIQENQKKLLNGQKPEVIIRNAIKEKLNHINGNLYTKEIEIVSKFFDEYPKKHAYIKNITLEDIIKETGLDQKVVIWILNKSGLFETKGPGWIKK